MKLHERHQQTVRAEIEIRESVARAAETHSLTFPELIHILSSVIQSWAKYEVRGEREETIPEVDPLRL